MDEGKNSYAPLKKWLNFCKLVPQQWGVLFKVAICRVSKVLRTYVFQCLGCISMSMAIILVPQKGLFLTRETRDV